VLPELCALNPQALCHMNRTAERMRDLRDYMDGQTTARAEQLLAERDGDFVLPVEALCDMPRALRMRLIHRAVGEAAGARKDISAVHIEAVEQLLWKQSGRRVDLPYGIVAKRVYGELVIGAGNRGGAQKPDGTQCSDGSRFPDGVMWADAAHREIRVDIDLLSIGNPLVITLSDGQLICRVFPFFGNIAKIPQKLYTKWFDYDKIKDNFSIRTRRTGDFFILDDAGHHKKLADYFIGEKIPADRRDEYLLVAQESKVLWVIGGRMGCDVGVSEDTHMILEMTFTKARKI
jgi:tRNA(Ile)-lysidine synthase